MIASCTSSWNSESCTLRALELALDAQLGRDTLSGFRFGLGDVNVVPVETS